MVSAVFQSTNPIRNLKFSISNILSPEFGSNKVINNANILTTTHSGLKSLHHTIEKLTSSIASSSSSSSSSSTAKSSSTAAATTTTTTKSLPVKSSSSSTSKVKSNSSLPRPIVPRVISPIILSTSTDSSSSSTSSSSPLPLTSPSCNSHQKITNHHVKKTSKRSLEDNESDQSHESKAKKICLSSSSPSSNNNLNCKDKDDDTHSICSTTSNSSSSAPFTYPAWVFCTRYSDRPSSGPRSRKIRSKKEKKTDEKRPRTAFSAEQLARLKQEFNDNHYLTEKRRQDLSRDLKLNESQIKIWFQNKRAKIKKSTGSRNPLALHLMAQGLYNHSTMGKEDGGDEDEDDEDDDDYLDDEKSQRSS